jgi:hypothetical protein
VKAGALGKLRCRCRRRPRCLGILRPTPDHPIEIDLLGHIGVDEYEAADAYASELLRDV